MTVATDQGESAVQLEGETDVLQGEQVVAAGVPVPDLVVQVEGVVTGPNGMSADRVRILGEG